MKNCKKTIKIIHLSALLLFGIALKASLLFYMNKQIWVSEFYIYHEWLNFALDSVAVFAGFYFLIKKVKRTWLQTILAVLASAYTYVCVMAEKLMFVYQFYSVWGGYESDVVSVEYHGMAAELLDTVSSCSLLYVRTFVLLTAILCAFAILLSNKETEDADPSPSVNKKTVWILLTILLVLDCYLKAIAYFTASYISFDPLYCIFGSIGSSEKLNYICDILVFLLMFAVLNTKIRKLAWNIVSIITLSLITTGIVMLENIVFLYRSDWCWYNYGDMTETKYIIRYFTSAFTTVRPHYIFIAIGFSLACVVILICNIPKIKEKLILVCNFVRNWFVTESDDKEVSFSFHDDKGNHISVLAERFTSIPIKSDEVDENIVISKDKNIENRYYMYRVDNEGYIAGDVSVFSDIREMYKAYANLILLASDLLFIGDEK